MTKPEFKSVSTDFIEGFQRVSRPGNSRLLSESQQRAVELRESRVASAAEFFTDLLNGQTPYYFLREALQPSSRQMAETIENAYPGLYRPMTMAERHYAAAYVGDESLIESHSTSDFPLLMGDVLDRMMLQRFAEVPQVWRNYISVGRPLRDFRLARLLMTDGGDGQWDDLSEEEGIQYASITESGKSITPKLYGKGVRLSWQLLMNDDLDAFAEVPNLLARGGRRTISKYATGLLFTTTGPQNVTALASNPALSVANLATAVGTFAALTDSEGEPIALEGLRLVVGPGLYVTAKNILETLTADLAAGGGTSTQIIRVNNWMVRGMSLVVDPYIPIVATTNGATSWILTTDPNTTRPAARMRFLNGFAEPQMYQKAPNTMRVNGGIDPSVGNFDSMATEYKGLVAFGGAAIEAKAAVGSNGSGS